MRIRSCRNFPSGNAHRGTIEQCSPAKRQPCASRVASLRCPNFAPALSPGKSFLYPRSSSSSGSWIRGRRRRRRARLWGTNLDFAKIKLEFFQAIPPCEIAVTTPGNADFRGNVAMRAPILGFRTHENLRGLYLTLFRIPRGSASGPLLRSRRSLSFVG